MSDIVSGTCDNKFNKLKQIFISQFNNSHELGASISVEYNRREDVFLRYALLTILNFKNNKLFIFPYPSKF